MSKQVVVVGGGLAGLSAAARLTHHGYSVTLLEKSPKLGGRAITIPMKGFNFNFGAHAIYGRDKSVLRKLESEIELPVDWKDFSPAKALYDLGSIKTPMPATLANLLKTKILDNSNKVRFAIEILKTLTSLAKGKEGLTIGEVLQGENEQIRDLFLTLASSNFFTNEPERIPSPVFFEYYQRLFATKRPVAYIGGGWQSIVEAFAKIVEDKGGTIVSREKATRIEMEDNQVVAVHGKEQVYKGDLFIFCVPPKELSKLFAETGYDSLFNEYEQYRPTQVVVYDIGLSERYDNDFTYIYNKEKKVFITDISYYDPTSAPEGGQLLQAIAYLNEEEINRNQADEKMKDIEEVYDKHFPNWKDRLVTKRLSKKATVQEIKCVDDQRLMPTKFYSLPNSYFAGDWCNGEGQLSELSFSSAYHVADQILQR